ncbi:MAG TPA: hypothetical protein DCZ12_05340, partial [Gammaproteobacteria bacterium]|nr:hypothetical protein [Gammaproteobacteria bacterium]
HVKVQNFGTHSIGKGSCFQCQNGILHIIYQPISIFYIALVTRSAAQLFLILIRLKTITLFDKTLNFK